MDEISQREKREVLRNDSYFSRQQNTPDDAGGRYSKLNPAKITGSTPSPVPQQPPSSPWSKGIDEVAGREGPLGFDIEYVGALGGESSAPVSTPETVETANATSRGESSPTALTELSPRFLRRRI